ncbi:MAG: nucleotidyltransferase domain-containing protein [Bacteroidaceae bacterium]|nr:nucleotidyltransferase domain-containing protein [Bacteroidaceae bacterium]
MSTNTIKKTVAEYFKTQPVVKAWLFGSYARGEETPDSDIDILVMYDRTQPIGLFKISGMHLDLERILGREVDLVDEETLFPWVEKYVNHDKELIYERAS